jgi:hypothetical protein
MLRVNPPGPTSVALNRTLSGRDRFRPEPRAPTNRQGSWVNRAESDAGQALGEFVGAGV